MKILQVNCVYKKGSTGKIVYDIHSNLLKLGYESIVCYGRGDKLNEKNVYKTSTEFFAKVRHFISNITGLHYNKTFFATNKLTNIIKKENPDVVHLHCLNGYFVNIYRLLDFLKKKNIKTVLTLHAEFMHTGNCGYSLDCEKWKIGCGNCPNISRNCGTIGKDNTHKAWLKMKNSFDGFSNLRVVSVSEWLKERAEVSPILKDKKHEVIYNGLDTSIFKVYHSELKSCLGLKNEKIILHVTPSFMSEIKGGKYVIELAKKMKDENVKILIIGNKDKTLNLPENIIDIGRIDDQRKLAEFYSIADLTLLTSKKETFSMIVAESLSCGTPIVGFEAGAPEMITIKEYSDFVEYGNLDLLEKKVRLWMNADIDKTIISTLAKEKYSSEIMANKYIKLYKEELNAENKK